MRFLRSFLVASFVPLAVLLFCGFRLWQETGADPATLLRLPLQRLAASGLVDAARGGDVVGRLCLVLIGAAVLAAVSFASFVVALVLSLAVGRSRPLMAAVFPVFSLIILVGTTAFVIGDVLLLFGAIWSSAAGAHASVTQNGVSFWSVVLLVVGVLTVLGLIGALARMFFVPAMGVLGVQAHAPDHAKILSFVEDVARRVGARPPKNVVLGMDLNFFATNAPLRPLGEGKIKGESLYLSLPCLRLLSEGELRAIVGHELGHFSGRDTAYSMAFAPAFHGLGEAVAAVRRPLWRIPNLLGWLASARLSYVAFLFQRNHAAVSRERELFADQKGAEASSPTDLAAALIKMFILAQIWALQAHVNEHRLRRGRVMRNLSLSFSERVRYDAETLRLPELVKDSLLYETQHPTDQHPRTSERIRALNVPVASVADWRAIGERLYPAAPASALLDDMRFAEEQLTQLVQRIMIGLGARPADDSHEQANFINNVFCQLLAHMVIADRKVDPREIDVAEAEALELVPDFDSDGFREFCRDEQPLAELGSLLEVANKMLTDSGKQHLLELLDHIAMADKKVVPEESEVLKTAREILMA